MPTVDFTLRRQANHRGLSLRRGLVAWVCCLVPTTCLVTGCGTAPSAPQSRLGSLAVEPELRMTKTSGAQQRQLRIPDVTTPAKPFRLADMEAALRPMQLAWGIESPDSSTRVQQVAAFDGAVRRGDLVWADSPMNLNAGVVGEPGMFEAMLDIAGTLNERYNLTKTHRVWSNVDVPGFVRASIPLLRRAGVTTLSICANVGGDAADSGAVPCVRGI